MREVVLDTETTIDRSDRSQHGALIDCQLPAQVYAHLKSHIPANRSPIS